MNVVDVWVVDVGVVDAVIDVVVNVVLNSVVDVVVLDDVVSGAIPPIGLSETASSEISFSDTSLSII